MLVFANFFKKDNIFKIKEKKFFWIHTTFRFDIIFILLIIDYIPDYFRSVYKLYSIIFMGCDKNYIIETSTLVKKTFMNASKISKLITTETHSKTQLGNLTALILKVINLEKF